MPQDSILRIENLCLFLFLFLLMILFVRCFILLVKKETLTNDGAIFTSQISSLHLVYIHPSNSNSIWRKKVVEVSLTLQMSGFHHLCLFIYLFILYIFVAHSICVVELMNPRTHAIVSNIALIIIGINKRAIAQ